MPPRESDREILERIDKRLDRIESNISLLVEVVKLHSIRFDSIDSQLKEIKEIFLKVIDPTRL